jgi:ATP-dependent Lon protease
MSNRTPRPPGSESDDVEIPDEIPLLPIRDLVIFPFMIVPLIVTRDISANAIEEALASGSERLVFLVTQKTAEDEDPRAEDLHPVGCIGMIMRMAKMNDGRVKVLVQGLVKARVKRFLRSHPSFAVEPERVVDVPLTGALKVEAEALVRTAKDNLDRYITLGKTIPQEVMMVVQPIEDAGRLSDLIASNLSLKVEEGQALLEMAHPVERLARVNGYLERELEILNLQQRIQDQARQEMTKTQREYYLREQMRAIRSELGDEDSKGEELDELRAKLEEARLPEIPQKEAVRQLRRLSNMHGESSEAAVLRNYLDWLVELPWAKQTEDNMNLRRALEILDQDHYGLDKIKERVIEHLAVRKLKQDMKGPILCFVGPPGVGKTSLGRSIARAMDRKFAQASLGGLRDEAEIRGHRRTYVGAMPGRIIQGLKQAGSRNPVFMLDELDKLGADFRGDPSSALLEVLDPAQNSRFVDLYLNVPFDLSNVLFIATANVVDTIPGPLRDRMELIFLSGYTEEEKLAIAMRHILPRNMDDHGLTKAMLGMPTPTLSRVIADYTREAGLRNLDRKVAALCRKVARKVAEGKTTRTVITPARLPEYLGPPRPPEHAMPERDELGVVTGLAWTQAGGDVLQVEATHMRGTGSLKLTGQLGEVMKESAHAALSFLRSRADAYGIEPDFFKDNEIHVHVPAGAIPKDGPSAGVTLATAIASIALRTPVRADVAMTGEITLRGHVLAVGGIKEKLLAAARAGIRTVLLPAANEADLADLPANVRRRLRIVPCRMIDDVFREALTKPIGPPGVTETAPPVPVDAGARC